MTAPPNDPRRAAAQLLGRAGGLARSSRKAAASAANGRKGGRPRTRAPLEPAPSSPEGDAMALPAPLTREGDAIALALDAPDADPQESGPSH